MKSLTELWTRVREDLGSQCDTSDLLADIKTVSRRTEEEGLGFLTLTLPQFCSDFERSLELGLVSSDLFLSFKKRGGLPAFLSGFLRRIFDGHGRLRDDADVVAIATIRQLTLIFKKIEIEPSPKRVEAAIRSYRTTDSELGSMNLPLSPGLSRCFAVLFGDMLRILDRKIENHELSGKHGPGAVFEGKVGNQKFSHLEWPESLDSVLPGVGNIVPNWRYLPDISFVDDDAVPPVRVVTVPKTQKGPRVIAVEPIVRQFAQQALWQEIPGALRYCPFPKIIGFRDQETNRELARKGSRDRSLATIDLSEASDRVHWDLVQYLFADYPNVLDFLEASRSRFSLLPNGELIELSKFASMGSALCFPVESMVFATICAYAVMRDIQPEKSGASIRVFGDDIIIPSDWYTSVVEELEAFGLKVNTEKSFVQGDFRESCGGDYFRGTDVTPIRVKHLFDSRDWRTATGLPNTVSVQNRLYESGLFRAASYLADYVERNCKSRLPSVNPWETGLISSEINFLAWFRDENSLTTRIHPGRFALQVKTLHLSKPEFDSELDGVAALMKCLSNDWSDPVYSRHLVQYGRGRVANMKRGWVDSSTAG